MLKLILKKEKVIGGSFMKKWDATKAKVKKQQADDLMDPYLNAIEYKDKSVCSKCRSIYHDKRWAEDKELYNLLMKDPEKVIFTVCPACRKIETKYIFGSREILFMALYAVKTAFNSRIRRTSFSYANGNIWMVNCPCSANNGFISDNFHIDFYGGVRLYKSTSFKKIPLIT